MLFWLGARYPGHAILVTENGCAQPGAAGAADGALDDGFRLAYLRDHVNAAVEAYAAGVDFAAYYAWSLLVAASPWPQVGPSRLASSGGRAAPTALVASLRAAPAPPRAEPRSGSASLLAALGRSAAVHLRCERRCGRRAFAWGVPAPVEAGDS